MSPKSQNPYTTIPTTISSPSNSNLQFFSKPNQTPKPHIRPWKQFLDPSSLSKPYNYTESTLRLTKNLNHFRQNYALSVLFILFLSLLWHPLSMIVFFIVFVGWVYLYFSRDDGVVIWARRVGDGVVLVVLSLVTVVAVAFTNVGLNVLVSMVIGAVVVALHGVFRVTDDLFLDEEEAVDGGLVSVVNG